MHEQNSKRPWGFQAWLIRLLYRKLVKYGPAMFHARDGWIYVDPYGDWYFICQTGIPGDPLTIIRTEVRK